MQDWIFARLIPNWTAVCWARCSYADQNLRDRRSSDPKPVTCTASVISRAAVSTRHCNPERGPGYRDSRGDVGDPARVPPVGEIRQDRSPRDVQYLQHGYRYGDRGFAG